LHSYYLYDLLVINSYFLKRAGNIYRHKVSIPAQGDFLINNRHLFEVGGKNKTFAQIKNIENSFLATDGLEIGVKNKIPLWVFGFLY